MSGFIRAAILITSTHFNSEWDGLSEASVAMVDRSHPRSTPRSTGTLHFLRFHIAQDGEEQIQLFTRE